MTAIYRPMERKTECVICGKRVHYYLTIFYATGLKTMIELCEDHKPEHVELFEPTFEKVTMTIIESEQDFKKAEDKEAIMKKWGI